MFNSRAFQLTDIVLYIVLYSAIYVYIEGEFIGSITSFITNGVTPECGADGFATGTIDVGNGLSFSASCGLYTWEGSINITTDGCTIMQLNY